MSSSLHGYQMYTELCDDCISVMFTIMHCCKHDTDILTNSRSLLCIYLTSMERGAHPVKELINCVHFYLNLYVCVCVCVCTLLYEIHLYDIPLLRHSSFTTLVLLYNRLFHFYDILSDIICSARRYYSEY